MHRDFEQCSPERFSRIFTTSCSPSVPRSSLDGYSHCSDCLPEAAQNNEITVFRCPLGAGRRLHSRRESFLLNIIAKNNGKKTVPRKLRQMSQFRENRGEPEPCMGAYPPERPPGKGTGHTKILSRERKDRSVAVSFPPCSTSFTITKPLLFSEKAPTMKREPFSSR